MRPIKKIAIYSSVLFVIFLISLRPYNWFCQSSGSCSKFFVSDLLPRFEGTEKFSLTFETQNQSKYFDFTVESTQSVVTVAGRKNVVKYKIANLSDKKIFFRPKFEVEPKEYESYINREDCLCFEEYTLEPHEEMNLQTSFSLDKDIEEDGFFKYEKVSDIIIRYSSY